MKRRLLGYLFVLTFLLTQIHILIKTAAAQADQSELTGEVRDQLFHPGGLGGKILNGWELSAAVNLQSGIASAGDARVIQLALKLNF